MPECPTPMTFCKASMIDAQLRGNTYLVKIYSELIDKLNKLAELQEAVRWERSAMRAFNEACMPDAGYGEITWATENLKKARAAVDALVGGEKG